MDINIHRVPNLLHNTYMTFPCKLVRFGSTYVYQFSFGWNSVLFPAQWNLTISFRIRSSISNCDIVEYFCLIILAVATSLSLSRSLTSAERLIGAFTNFVATLYSLDNNIIYIYISWFCIFRSFAKRIYYASQSFFES